MARKKATAKKSASLPKASGIPEGMTRIGQNNAPTWKPEIGDSIHGTVTDDIREVPFEVKRRVGGKTVTETNIRRVVEITDMEGEAHAVWESAALTDLFAKIEEFGTGLTVYIAFTGLGKAKKGQQPPKLFDVAYMEAA